MKISIKRCSRKAIADAISRFNLLTDPRIKSILSGSVLMLKHDIPHKAYLAKHEDQIVGWGVIWKVSKEAHMYVIPKWRNQGIGSRLMSKMEADPNNNGFCPWDKYSTRFFNKRTDHIHENFNWALDEYL